MLRVTEMGQDGQRRVGKSSEELSFVRVTSEGRAELQEGFAVGSEQAV